MSATTMLAEAPGGTERRSPTYQVLVDDIKALGVEQVFGLMSDDTAVFATALDSSGIRFYGARHENNAIAMAEGFSYATGGLGVAVAMLSMVAALEAQVATARPSPPRPPVIK